MEKMFAVIFICGNVFLRIAGKIAKIRTRKNFVPHGSHLTYKLFSKSYLFIDFRSGKKIGKARERGQFLFPIDG